MDIYGTSHVSQESIELVEDKMEEKQPDIVALELDLGRLRALKRENSPDSNSTLFIRLIELIQNYIGEKTGVMPGEEMEYAYDRAAEIGADVALIDQELEVTVRRLRSIPRKEKVRAALSIIAGAVVGGRFKIDEIPEAGRVDRMLEELEEGFPELHRVLIEERNSHMAESLIQLREERPEEDIVAFVGEGHRKALEDMISE